MADPRADRAVYHAYRSLFKMKTVLYQIGDIRLWMPIDQDLILLWLQVFLLFLLFYYVIPLLRWISPVGPALTLSVGPAALAYTLHKLDPAGKSTSAYLRDILRFLIRKKTVRRFEYVSLPRARRTIKWSLSGRRYQTVDLPDGQRLRFFYAEAIAGRLQPGTTLRVYPKARLRWHTHSQRFTLTPLTDKQALRYQEVRTRRKRSTWEWAITEPADLTLTAADASVRTHTRRGTG
ncbi:TcpE family conjugal transfer membrane protein [Alicyclobacillus fodiniaquatilis]|uniref:TcpE family conjugal transfer membrane protein n=1 Tax=Alicyclobacillus fodiniaquatilis TaxID=1661150 RepID=A0ABW4JEK0_9BACL